MNKTSITCFCVNLSFRFFGISPMQFLGHMLVAWLDLLETAELFSRVLIPFFHSQQQCASNSVSLHPCQQLVLLLFFYFSHSDRYVVISYCCYKLHIPNGWYTFMDLFVIWWFNAQL